MNVLFAGVLDPLERPLTVLLEWLHSSGGLSWAWAIVALTVIVRIVIVPLAVKQIHSMQRLQAHAPELKALQAKYKNDKQRLNEEVMKFYRENKVNPAASCLPILVQAPIFLALFFILRDFEKEVFPKYPQSELGWLSLVPDITEPINSHWSGYLLLTLYVGSQVASTYFMSATMDKRQRYLFMALPFLFIFFILGFPMGLMLYWTTTNLWTVGQGLITRRLIPKAPPPPKRTSRTEPQRRDDGDAGDGAKRAAPKPKAGPSAAKKGSGQVRRRKKKGPRAKR
jgi:YidC/Oxa1 family membrane protein insertase